MVIWSWLSPILPPLGTPSRIYMLAKFKCFIVESWLIMGLEGRYEAHMKSTEKL